MDGISKSEIVEEVGSEMVVRFDWTKIVLYVYDGTIVNGQSFWREKVGCIVCGLCGGRRDLDLGLCFVLECTVEATITGSFGPIKDAYSFGDSSSTRGSPPPPQPRPRPLLLAGPGPRPLPRPRRPFEAFEDIKKRKEIRLRDAMR
jgi:hypothetical protein